jgi:two-component system, chemotaxis family, protein-glutamate methylesterase/glutaminase
MNRTVAVGTSSGGLEALRALLGALPVDFPAPLCIVMHVAAEGPGILPAILNRSTALEVRYAADGDPLRTGRVYIAPPDRHLLVEPGRLRVSAGPRENRFRPAIDPLFRSVAQVFGPSAVGVLLTGSLDDGTSGLDVIKRLGGVAVVQDPADALFPEMPQSAIDHVAVDHVVPLAEMGPLLIELMRAPAQARAVETVPEHVEVEVKIAKAHNPIEAGLEWIGEPSRFACPECHGVLLQLEDGSRVRFRCHTGHAYSVDSLVAAISDGVDESLWNAMRSLEEAGLLLQAMAQLQTEHGVDARQMAAQAEAAQLHAHEIRALVGRRKPLTTRRPADAG